MEKWENNFSRKDGEQFGVHSWDTIEEIVFEGPLNKTVEVWLKSGGI